MNSDNDSPHQPKPRQQKATDSFQPLKPLALLVAVVFIAVVAGTGGYFLGMRRNTQVTPPSQPSPSPQSITLLPTIEPSPTPFIPKTLYSVPTTNPTTNWKTYTNAQWGLSFKYPETWFPQEVPNCCPPGSTIRFYLYGVTPHPGGGDDPTNAVITVENQEGHSQQTDEQFISEARQTDGKRVLNVAGKPAIRGDGYNGEWYYNIKLSSTRADIEQVG